MRGDDDRFGLQGALCSTQPYSIRNIVPGGGMWHEPANAVVTDAFVVATNYDPTAASESNRHKEID